MQTLTQFVYQVAVCLFGVTVGVAYFAALRVMF